jgi:hypothetical protein
MARKRLAHGALLDRERQAVALHLQGETSDAIADALGFVNRGGAWKAVQRGLARFVVPAIAEARTVELARLDRLHKAVWQRAISGDIPAIETVLRLMERRARLLGLDAPVRVDLRALVADSATRFGLDEAERRALFDRLSAYLAEQRVMP